MVIFSISVSIILLKINMSGSLDIFDVAKFLYKQFSFQGFHDNQVINCNNNNNNNSNTQIAFINDEVIIIIIYY